MQTVILVVHIMIAAGLVGLILMQRSEGGALGIGGRKLIGKPKMVDNSQKSGKVNVEVCVNQSGDVISANFTQRGSTTNDSELRNKAINWAKQHKFGSSTNEKECGTILFNFTLQ